MHGSGLILFILALLLVFLHLRTAAVSALVASILCLPLYVYFAFPRFFRQVFPGEYSVPLQAFHWDVWAVVGVLSTGFMVYLSYRNLHAVRRP